MIPQQVEINVLFECIEKGLDHLGRNFRTIVLSSPKTEQNIEGKMMVQQALTFASDLRRMFGAGSGAVEKSIVEGIGHRFVIFGRQMDLVSIINGSKNSYGADGGGRF